MNKTRKLVILLVLLFLIGENGFAQQASFFKKHRYTSIGVSLNAMNYVGELDPGPSFLSPGVKFTRLNIGATYTKRIAPRYSLRGGISWGRIKGDDQQNAGFNNKDVSRKFRNLSFRNDIIEIKADFVVDLWENRGRHTKRPDYTPYGFIGLAYFHHNPKAYYKGHWVALHPLHTENKNYSLNQIALPVGIGARYKLAKQWDLAFEVGWRFTLTDYLDDVSGKYADKSKLKSQAAIDLSDRSGELHGNDNLAPYVARMEGSQDYPTGFVPDPYSSSGYRVNNFGATGIKRGDRNRDWYIVTGFHLNYIIPERVICPKFRTYHNKIQQKLLAQN